MERMAKNFRPIIVLLIIGTFLLQIVAIDAKPVEKRQIIMFDESVSVEKKNYILEKHDAKKIKSLNKGNIFVVNAPIVNDIAFEAGVLAVENDYHVKINGQNNKSKGLEINQPEQIIPWGVEFMNNLVADNQTTTSELKIAVIDTGIDTTHPDLVDNIAGGYNATSKKKSYEDTNGHGTHVSGIIAAVNNEIGVVGVAPYVDLFALKALDSYGNGHVSDVIDCIEWSINNDIDIINMSISLNDDSQMLHQAIVKAVNAGIYIVAAAGNNGGICEYPAAYEEVIGVGALDSLGQVASDSAKLNVDVWAPGVDIYSTHLDGKYTMMSGTSMAAPHWIKMIILDGFN